MPSVKLAGSEWWVFVIVVAEEMIGDFDINT